MKFDISDMSGEVYTKSEKGVYYVKISFPKLGMYINSITVRPSPKFSGELWVQMPSINIGRWIKIIEFQKGSELQELMTDEALRAVDSYNRDQFVPELVSDDDLRRKIDEVFGT